MELLGWHVRLRWGWPVVQRRTPWWCEHCGAYRPLTRNGFCDRCGHALKQVFPERY